MVVAEIFWDDLWAMVLNMICFWLVGLMDVADGVVFDFLVFWVMEKKWISATRGKLGLADQFLSISGTGLRTSDDATRMDLDGLVHPSKPCIHQNDITAVTALQHKFLLINADCFILVASPLVPPLASSP